MSTIDYIDEHNAGFHGAEWGGPARAPKCPLCHPDVGTAEGAERIRAADLEAELRVAQAEIGLLRAIAANGATGSATAPKPPSKSGMLSLGDAIGRIMERRRADGHVELPPDPETESPLDGGSMCPTCKGGRLLLVPEARTARPGEPHFNETMVCPDCPEGKALGERKTSLPSGVPTEFATCRFETYPVTAESKTGFEALQSWMAALTGGQECRPMFYLTGPFGVGKSSLSAACVFAWEEATGGRGLWITANELLDRIRAGYDPSTTYTADEVVERVKTTKFLAIDDLGVERVTPWVVEKLFDLINSRHNNALPTIFTSNLTLRQLADHLNAGTPADLPQPGERIMWRIISSATCQELKGPNLHNPSMRLRLGT